MERGIIRRQIYGGKQGNSFKKRRKKRNNLLIISKLEDRLGSLPRAAAWEIIGDS